MKIGNKSVIVAALAGAAGLAIAGGNTGPDVIVGDLTGPANYGTVGGIAAFAIGTTSCNLGTENLDWFDNSNRHPVIGQNIFAIRDGRIDQIGQSYLKHGFCALQLALCGPCTPAGGGCASLLGVGCSDPYSSSLNGSQGGLGPKRDINPSTGFFTWPFSQIGQGGNAIFKRVQVETAKLDYNAQQNGDVVYLAEGLYVAADDAAAGNDANNASYRLLNLRSNGVQFTYQGSTQREQPAIRAWADHGNGVSQPDAGVQISMYDLPQDGVVFVGSNVVDNGDGTYTYYYAIENLTSDRAAQALRIPLNGADASNFYFNDVDYHSGSPYDNTDWSASVVGDEVVFRSPQTFAQNSNTNALRWGTMYTFGFTSTSEPTSGSAAVEYFKPFATLDSEYPVDVQVPTGGPSGCNAADLAEPFGELDITDVVAFLQAFGAQDEAADIGTPFGAFDINDVVAFLQTFGAGCP